MGFGQNDGDDVKLKGVDSGGNDREIAAELDPIGSALYQLLSSAMLRGGTDGIKIGNIGDRLKVAASLSIADTTCASQFTEQTLTSSWISIDSHTGEGVIGHASVQFDSDDVSVRVLINGTIIYSFDTIKLTLSNNDFFTGSAENTGINLPFIWNKADKVFHWVPPGGAGYSTSFNIEVRSTAGKKMTNYLICSSKE